MWYNIFKTKRQPLTVAYYSFVLSKQGQQTVCQTWHHCGGPPAVYSNHLSSFLLGACAAAGSLRWRDFPSEAVGQDIVDWLRIPQSWCGDRTLLRSTNRREVSNTAVCAVWPDSREAFEESISEVHKGGAQECTRLDTRPVTEASCGWARIWCSISSGVSDARERLKTQRLGANPAVFYFQHVYAICRSYCYRPTAPPVR